MDPNLQTVLNWGADVLENINPTVIIIAISAWVIMFFISHHK